MARLDQQGEATDPEMLFFTPFTSDLSVKL